MALFLVGGVFVVLILVAVIQAAWVYLLGAIGFVVLLCLLGIAYDSAAIRRRP